MDRLTYPDAHVHCAPGLDLPDGAFVNATCEDDWSDCLDVATEANGVAFLGIHPWFLEDARDGWQDRLRGLAEDNVIGIGEIGLDRFRGPDLRDQIEAFECQFELAMGLGRPVSLHCVKRWGALIEVLRRHAPFSAHVMVHGFRASAEVQASLLGLGCHVSFGFGLIDGSADLREAWKRTPDDRLLLESDAPDSLSQSGDGYVTSLDHLLSEAAALRGVSTADLAGALRRNALAFLGR